MTWVDRREVVSWLLHALPYGILLVLGLHLSRVNRGEGRRG